MSADTSYAKPKIDESYWSHIWEHTDLPKRADPAANTVGNYLVRRYHRFFSEAFGHITTAEGGKPSILEIGGARSEWLPYFAVEHGFEVATLDYSEIGCKQAQAVLDANDIQGAVHCADMFDPPKDLLGQYDVVFSLGVLEHFEETGKAIEAASKFLKPGGLLVSVIPNLAGIPGFVQKHLGRDIYDIHVPLDRDMFASAHHEAGLELIECDYLMTLSLYVLVAPENSILRLPLRIAASLLTRAIWFLERIGMPEIRARANSPYVVAVARRPA